MELLVLNTNKEPRRNLSAVEVCENQFFVLFFFPFSLRTPFRYNLFRLHCIGTGYFQVDLVFMHKLLRGSNFKLLDKWFVNEIGFCHTRLVVRDAYLMTESCKFVVAGFFARSLSVFHFDLPINFLPVWVIGHCKGQRPGCTLFIDCYLALSKTTTLCSFARASRSSPWQSGPYCSLLKLSRVNPSHWIRINRNFRMLFMLKFSRASKCKRSSHFVH